MTSKRTLALALAAASAIVGACGEDSATAATAATLNARATSVQMFEWSWNDIATECTQWLGPQGYGGVQISPPEASLMIDTWYGVYQPVNYTQLTSRFGTAAELQTMINTCHAAGVRVYADVVFNQMAGSSGTATDGSTWDSSTLTYPYFSSNDFHTDCDIEDSDYDSASTRDNVTNCRLDGMPDLNTESSYVQEQIETYLRLLLNMGVDGFRIDAAKHIAPSSLQTILSAVKSTNAQTLLGESLWITQEVIPDSGVTRSDYYATGTLNEFQFTYAMRDVFRGNDGLSLASIPTVMGTWGDWGGSWYFIPPEDAVIFVNNWDTERDDSLTAANHVSGATNDEDGSYRYSLANIFMLTQGYGDVQVFSGFNFTDVNADRPTASPYVDGVAQVNQDWQFVHRWPQISNMVKFRAAMDGQAQQNWAVGDNDNEISFNRGSVGFVAINNSTSSWTQTFSTHLPEGTYCNVVQGTLNSAKSACTGGTVTVDSNGNATLTLNGNDGTSGVPAVVIYTGQKLSS
jgi:alpha-amylase